MCCNKKPVRLSCWGPNIYILCNYVSFIFPKQVINFITCFIHRYWYPILLFVINSRCCASMLIYYLCKVLSRFCSRENEINQFKFVVFSFLRSSRNRPIFSKAIYAYIAINWLNVSGNYVVVVRFSSSPSSPCLFWCKKWNQSGIVKIVYTTIKFWTDGRGCGQCRLTNQSISAKINWPDMRVSTFWEEQTDWSPYRQDVIKGCH